MIVVKVIFGTDGDFGILEELHKLKASLESILRDKIYVDFDFDLLHQGGPIIEINNKKKMRVYNIDDVIRLLYHKDENIDDANYIWQNKDDGGLSMGVVIS
ncbi:MAG: hypothetical protein OWQ54_07205 [Sulfolobaceae archaeon]|nr:hypothetical protein [Sulfolobaceae archaeon]